MRGMHAGRQMQGPPNWAAHNVYTHIHAHTHALRTRTLTLM